MSNITGAAAEGEPKSYFEEQRMLLCREIATSLEDVLQNLNKVNRALEGVIALGNEFSSVEALWSQFESVMGAGREENEVDVDAEADSGAEEGGEVSERTS